MKKKIMSVLLIAVMVMAMFTGCGNMSLGMGNYEFEKIHVDTYHYSGCLTVDKWYDNTTGIEVDTKEFGAIYLSEGQYMLIEDECPFCAANEAGIEAKAEE